MLLGGALTSALSWSWIFFINVPAGILVLAVSPWLLKESRADLAHRHFDFAGAASITGGLMLLVYAMTRAAGHGWATTETIGLLVASAALIVAFLVIEARSTAPLLPMRIFRLRTLTASNVSGLLMGGAIFSQFFLLTLYMQQVLHYSALKTGVAYIALTVTIISFSAVAQAMATRFGIRRTLPVGLALSAGALILFARLPVDGHYATDLLPAFLLSGIGLAMAFVPMSIGGLTGVRPADAGVASGLITTSQQIGGAIGVAAATTIATTYTTHFVTAHPGTSPLAGAALTHGFQSRVLRSRGRRRSGSDCRCRAGRAEAGGERDHARGREPRRGACGLTPSRSQDRYADSVAIATESAYRGRDPGDQPASPIGASN